MFLWDHKFSRISSDKDGVTGNGFTLLSEKQQTNKKHMQNTRNNPSQETGY